MNKEEKKKFAQELGVRLEKAKSFILVDFRGMGVKTQQELKKRLKSEKASFLVVKNKVLLHAGKTTDLPKETFSEAVLSGQTALITSETDPLTLIKTLGQFMEEFVSNAGYPVPQFKVGVLDGIFQDKDSLVKISKLPAKEVLYQQTIGALSTPPSQLVFLLKSSMEKLVFILNQKREVI